MIGRGCNQRLRSFDESVAYHQHMAIQSDLNELILDCPPPPPPSTRSVPRPIPSAESCFASPFTTESPFQSPRLSVSSIGSVSTSPTGSYHRRILDEVAALSANSSPSVNRFCQVQFKYQYRNYVLPDDLVNVQVGEFLIVQSLIENLHEDLGVVTAVYTYEDFIKLNALQGPSDDADENRVGRVLRVATDEEKKLLPLKSEREGPLLKACQTFVDRFCLEMTVYGVEYQFDGNVLFVYYVSKGRVDFRSLVQHIVRIYCRKTRIQMKKTNQCREFIPERFASDALMTGQYFAPDGSCY